MLPNVIGGEVAAATLQRNATAAMAKVVTRVIAPIIIILSLPCREQKRQNAIKVKYWEIIADNLSKAGWSWGCVATVDATGRTIWVVAAERNAQRFIVHADEKLTAFMELEASIESVSRMTRRQRCG
jgi:hypothetical protein